MVLSPLIFFFFFFNDTATTEIYTLSLHDALPILTTTTWGESSIISAEHKPCPRFAGMSAGRWIDRETPPDRKSTRLNSSHLVISYAVFCLKKKNSMVGILNSRRRQ